MTTVTSPIDLLAAVPFLIGYQPSDAIVLMGLCDGSISMAVRIDFPTDISIGDAEALAGRFASDSEAILMVSYIPDDHESADEVIRKLTDALTTRGLSLRESIIIVAGRWRSLVCGDELCCPVEGSPLPEFRESRIAVEEVAQGKVLPFPDQMSMAESLAALPTDPQLMELIKQVSLIDYESDPTNDQRAGAEAILDFLTDFESAGICTDQALLATVLVRLQDLQVRDFALGSMRPDESERDFAAWRWLLRRAPVGFVAAPATIFAIACYERGDGAMANLALERARTDQADYALAGLLAKVFRSGQPPTLFKELRSELHPKVCAALFSGSMNL